jgi:hypothetical protein
MKMIFFTDVCYTINLPMKHRATLVSVPYYKVSYDIITDESFYVSGEQQPEMRLVKVNTDKLDQFISALNACEYISDVEHD